VRSFGSAKRVNSWADASGFARIFLAEHAWLAAQFALIFAVDCSRLPITFKEIGVCAWPRQT
jgi:hypothetical protein